MSRKKKKNKSKKKHKGCSVNVTIPCTTSSKVSKKAKKKMGGLTNIEMGMLCEKIKLNRNPITILSTVKKY